MGTLKQVCLLMWKNWILQKRKPCVTFFEISLPVAFAGLILAIRTLIDTDDITIPKYYPSNSIDQSSDFVFSKNLTIGYVPKVAVTSEIMDQMEMNIQQRFDPIRKVTVKGFDDEEALEEYFRFNSELMRQSIVFKGIHNDSMDLPKNLEYAIRPLTGNIRWRTEQTFPFFQSNSPRTNMEPDYYFLGILLMQKLVSESVTQYWLKKHGEPWSNLSLSISDEKLPYPPYFDDPMIQIVQTQLPLFIVLSFILSVIVNTKCLVYEKEKKLKESMKLMGLKASAHWISWFLTFMAYLIPALIIYALLLGLKISSKGAVLANTDASLFFFVLFCYSICLVSFCFMVSTFANKANVGAALSGILFFGTFFLDYYIADRYEEMTKGTKQLSSLLLNTGMAISIRVIGMYEGTGEGAQWSNFHKPATVDDNFSLLDSCIMLLVVTGIQLLITWYVDNVRPGEFGVPKPFYFPFMKSYWCRSSQVSDEMYDIKPKDEKFFEREPTEQEAGIKICDLKKKFGRNMAVSGTSMNMYKGQISVLLGHNGAGKTTTMSMLTGFIPPSGGTAVVNGFDIRKNIDGVRQSLGLCPQHNVLFGLLTVKEHLVFFAKLKGMSGSSVDKEAVDMAKEVGLEFKVNDRAHTLSGGQKRKLSVAIALIAGSKVVILDEPTSSMDPAARRQTWNILQKFKQDRTLMLSTHYMDEADVLGDRIAIMAEGVIKCCGSSMFLKKLYGAGYHLIVVTTERCDVAQLTAFVQSHVNAAELEHIINKEVSYLLPHHESSKFADLFRALETSKDKLGFYSFGTSATTMEEVFLKVGESATDEEQSDINSQQNGSTDNSFSNPLFEKEKDDQLENGAMTNGKESTSVQASTDIMAFNTGFKKHTGVLLWMSRVRGLFVKKMLHTWRNVSITLAQLLLPVIFTIIGLAISEAAPSGSDEPALRFDLKRYSDPVVAYSAGLLNISQHYANIFRDQFDGLYKTENIIVTQEENFSSSMVDIAESIGTFTYRERYIIGAEVVEKQANESIALKSYFSGEPFHAEPIALNYILNAVLKLLTDTDYNIQSWVHPMPKDEEERNKFNSLLALSTGFSISFFISFGMAFLTTMFIHFLIKERTVGAKHVQVVSGVDPITYWLPTLLWDFINYLIPSLLLLAVFAAYQQEAYVNDGRWAIIILVLAIYGWAVLPFMYFLQFGFSSPPTGVVAVIMLNIISGLVTSTTVFVLKIPSLNLVDIADTLNWVFMVLFPNYNMQQCFANIMTNYMSLDLCLKPETQAICLLPPQNGQQCCKEKCKLLDFCVDYEEDYLSFNIPGIGIHILFMVIQGCVYIAVVMLIEYHILQNIWYLIRGAQTNEQDAMAYISEASMNVEDSDVAEERKRINSSPASVLSEQDSLLLVNLYKRYGSFTAVDHICVGVPEKECFGLLGQNGAGKTTTFKMLTGDEMVTGGNAYLKGYDVRTSIKNVQSNMGYCPQFDALIDQMTGRETLTMYARLRGVPEDKIPNVVINLINILMFQEHADKLCGLYSGGNKRKLSTAIALVGDPSFIMLDEPSSAMDPKARRQLWNVLSQIRASGRTLVLTSHSMEECDALCTRIAIMVNGRFMCLGSPQHLKNKFGHGFTLIVRLAILENGVKAPNEPVINFLMGHFPEIKVFDDHHGYIHFQVPDSNAKLSDIFSVMESTKENLNVEDYTVLQTTLEQVFLTFTKGQVAPKEEKKRSTITQLCCCCCIKCGLYK